MIGRHLPVRRKVSIMKKKFSRKKTSAQNIARPPLKKLPRQVLNQILAGQTRLTHIANLAKLNNPNLLFKEGFKPGHSQMFEKGRDMNVGHWQDSFKRDHKDGPIKSEWVSFAKGWGNVDVTLRNHPLIEKVRKYYNIKGEPREFIKFIFHHRLRGKSTVELTSHDQLIKLFEQNGYSITEEVKGEDMYTHISKNGNVIAELVEPRGFASGIGGFDLSIHQKHTTPILELMLNIEGEQKQIK